ncbi:slit 1-like protein [Lasius niger]|uniref:Slit 1-like protein n=1 Tax=Lasius niger TaxID=67767 RepID=A0A0J7K4X3_LASNI|nr:slit 1-like protein [Lasius niger]
MTTIGASIIPEESMMPETSIIRPTSAYSSKINHHDLYIGLYNNNSTLERGGNGSMLLTTPVQMMPYTQSIHMMHAMNPSSSSLSTQQIYDNPPLPIYVMENKIDRQLM